MTGDPPSRQGKSRNRDGGAVPPNARKNTQTHTAPLVTWVPAAIPETAAFPNEADHFSEGQVRLTFPVHATARADQDDEAEKQKISASPVKRNGSSEIAQKKQDQPHYIGHRQRLRERFAKSEAGVADYELLELLLFRSIPRGDVKGTAKALIARFGAFAEVLAAPIERLMEVPGVGPAVAHDLKVVEVAGKRLAHGAVINRKVLGSWSSVIDYCRASMAFAELEELRILFLDKKNGMMADEVMQKGTVDHTPVYPREIIRRALTLNSSALILVHNHPTGDTTPSRADIEMTREIVSLAEPLGIVVHDHLIIGRKGYASFRALGLI